MYKSQFKQYKINENDSSLLNLFKDYKPISDEDGLNKELLFHFGFKPETLNTTFNNEKFIGLVGHKGNINAVSIIGGNKADYNNPDQIDEDTLKDIADTLFEKNIKQVVIITNCGVDLHSRFPFIKNIKIIKVPTSIK